MAKKSGESLRTKVRVKDAGEGKKPDSGAAAVPRGRSLMEALKQVTPQPASAPVKKAGTETAPKRPKAVKARRPGNRLKKLDRLGDGTGGLAALVPGEFEEATVEIIRHDGAAAANERRAVDQKSKDLTQSD